MQHLPLLKSLPIAPQRSDDGRGRVVGAADGGDPDASLVIIATSRSLFARTMPVPLSLRIAILIALAVRLLALNGALLTIQNGMAVLFPAWMRLGPAVTTGVEALGQNLLATMASVLSGDCADHPGHHRAHRGAVLHAERRGRDAGVIIFASGVLALETYGVMRYLAGVLAKAEPRGGVTSALLQAGRRAHHDRERARDADRAVHVVEPLAVRVRVAAAAAGADRDRGNALADRNVRVGRREREIGLASDETRRLDRRRERARARPAFRRRGASRSIRRGTLSARVPRARLAFSSISALLGDASNRALDLVELRRRRRAQIDLEPRRVGNRVHRQPAADATDGERRARRWRAAAARRVAPRRSRRRARHSATPNAAHEWPPGPAYETRNRREPSARWMMRSSPAPSSAIIACASRPRVAK